MVTLEVHRIPQNHITPGHSDREKFGREKGKTSFSFFFFFKNHWGGLEIKDALNFRDGSIWSLVGIPKHQNRYFIYCIYNRGKKNEINVHFGQTGQPTQFGISVSLWKLNYPFTLEQATLWHEKSLDECSRLHTPEKSILASAAIVTLPLDAAENLLCCVMKLCAWKRLREGNLG